MISSPTPAAAKPRALFLGVDTCGPSGSVALGESVAGELRILGQTELAGRTYSATLISAIGELLSQARIRLADLDAIVAVSGPGSFTGVRVGLSAVKGLAEAGHSIPVLAVSRLEVLASKIVLASEIAVPSGAGVPFAAPCAAALDAHRGEIFLRIAVPGMASRELLAGAQELAIIDPPAQIAVCDENAIALLETAWPQTQLVRVPAPTAADALALCLPRVLAGEQTDPALLDGHYLRRSDAEIFGDQNSPQARRP